MSLNNSDRTSKNRTSPQLNTSDNVLGRLAHSTNSTTYAPLNESARDDRLQFDNTRIVSYKDGIPNAIFGILPDGTSGFEAAQPGYDITTAADDEKAFSSNFNTYKIIATGEATLSPRNSSITIDATTNIGYMFQGSVDVSPTVSTRLGGKFYIRVYEQATGKDIRSGGLYYDDGTNVVMYDTTYYVDAAGILRILIKLRCTAGSYNFNPNTWLTTAIYWEISNQTYPASGGIGVAGSPTGKYFYLDQVTYDYDGNITSALASSTEEFVGSTPNFFPNPRITYY